MNSEMHIICCDQSDMKVRSFFNHIFYVSTISIQYLCHHSFCRSKFCPLNESIIFEIGSSPPPSSLSLPEPLDTIPLSPCFGGVEVPVDAAYDFFFSIRNLPHSNKWVTPLACDPGFFVCEKDFFDLFFWWLTRTPPLLTSIGYP